VKFPLERHKFILSQKILKQDELRTKRKRLEAMEYKLETEINQYRKDIAHAEAKGLTEFDREEM